MVLEFSGPGEGDVASAEQQQEGHMPDDKQPLEAPHADAPESGQDGPMKDQAGGSEAGTSARFRKEAEAGEDPTPTGADYS